jgi:hypothetical protein
MQKARGTNTRDREIPGMAPRPIALTIHWLAIKEGEA